MSSIKLINAVLDVSTRPGSIEDVLIVRGVIAPESFKEIQVDTYQREVESTAKVRDLATAIETSSVPDLELGMRGDRIREIASDKTIHLLDPVYVIDGLQRINGAKHLMQTKHGSQPRVGAMVHLHTEFNWERDRFLILNQKRTKVSPNKHLHNLQYDYSVLKNLWTLTNATSGKFVLNNRVTWSQKMKRTDLITASTMCKTVGTLLSRFGPGRGRNVVDLANGLDRIMGVMGASRFEQNVMTFFGLIEECFELKSIVFTHACPQIKSGFLSVFAELLRRHTDFWRGDLLFVDKDLRKKIALFPLRDPEVARLSSSSGSSLILLYQLMLNHVNSGKRTKRLQEYPGLPSIGGTDDEDEEASVES